MTFSGLSAAGVIKKYKHFQLGPIDLRLEPGSATGLLGANGAGKTTLLNCLAGQMAPNEGAIQWQGQQISLRNWKVREHIGFVTEYPSLYETLSAQDHIQFASHIFQNWDSEFASEWLKKFKLPPKQKVKEYSKGMKVKLSILIAISHRANLLLLDEPTSGLDPDTRFELQGYFSELVSAREVCLLLSSHLFEDIENVTKDVKIIRDGRITHGFSLKDLDKYVYVESGGSEDFTVQAESNFPSVNPAFSWKKGSRECLLFKKDEFESIRESNDFTGIRQARLEDIYFGSQTKSKGINSDLKS